jgi:hypothetical protein
VAWSGALFVSGQGRLMFTGINGTQRFNARLHDDSAGIADSAADSPASRAGIRRQQHITFTLWDRLAATCGERFWRNSHA